MCSVQIQLKNHVLKPYLVESRIVEPMDMEGQLYLSNIERFARNVILDIKKDYP